LREFFGILARSERTIVWLGGALSRYTNGIQSLRAIMLLQGLRDNLIGPGKGLLTMEGGKPEGEKEFVDHVCGPNNSPKMNFRRLLMTMKRKNLDLLFLNSSYRRYPDSKACSRPSGTCPSSCTAASSPPRNWRWPTSSCPRPSPRRARARISGPRSRWSGATRP
jgi:formate dehydrogenase major subunit